MAANNQVVLIGRAGNQVSESYRKLQGGALVAELRLAVNRPTHNEQGKPLTDWFSCQFWDQQAERLAELVMPGDLVSVSGSIRVDQWEKEDQKRSKAYIHGENFQILESKRLRLTRQSRPEFEDRLISNIGQRDPGQSGLIQKEDYLYPGHHLRENYFPKHTVVPSDPEAIKHVTKSCRHCGTQIPLRKMGSHLAECYAAPGAR